MNWKELYITIKSRVGLKMAVREKSKKLYRIYDKCDICPLSVYIDVVCNDNLKALVIKGHIPEKELNKVRTMLTIEFSELSGSSHITSTINIIRQIYLRNVQIDGLKIAAMLIQAGHYEQVIEYLKPLHIKLNNPNDDKEIDRVIKQVEGKIKGKIVSIRELQKRYDALTAITDSGKPKEENYTEMLIALSKYVGFHLKKEELTLSEFAFFLKSFNKEIERLNNKSHG